MLFRSHQNQPPQTRLLISRLQILSKQGHWRLKVSRERERGGEREGERQREGERGREREREERGSFEKQKKKLY